MKFYIDHTIKETSSRKCNVITCLFACFLVYLVCLLSKTIVSQASVIFLMIGEKERGEIDIIINTKTNKRITNDPIESNIYDNYFINFSQFEDIILNNSESNRDSSKTIIKTTSPRSLYYAEANNKSIEILLIDTDKERQMELGRSYPYSKLKEGQCLVSNEIVDKEKELEIEVDLNVFIKNTLILQYIKSNNITKINETESTIKFKCEIVDSISRTYGKLGEDEDSVIIMEMEYFFKHLSKYIPNKIKTYFPDYSNFLYNLNSKDYATSLVANFPPNRLNMYTDSDYDNILQEAVKYANSIVSKIGNYENIGVNLPLVRKMKNFSNGQVLLNLLLNLIVIILFILSFLLIYALLTITIETKSFEFGILRLIGTTKTDIIILIIIQCFSFSLPGFILAFIFQFPILKIINNAIKNIVDTELNLNYTNSSLLLAITVNFLSPILASIIPIRNILKKNIATSLNAMINKTIGIKFEIISLEKKETYSLITFGLVTFLYGASIYYFLPLSLLSLNFTIMGLILIWILLGIILGFIILSINIEMILQKILAYILMFPFKSYIRIITIKNLVAHRLKNRKITVMYSLSISIFLMTMVSLEMILDTLRKESLIKNGSEILLKSYDGYLSNPERIKYLMNDLYNNNLIENFGYITPSLSDECFDADIQIGNLGKNLYYNTYINGINSDYFPATQHVGLGIKSTMNYNNKSFNSLSPSEQLYLSGSKGRIGISALFDFQMNANVNEDVFLKLDSQNKKMTFLTKPAFLVDYAPGFVMNSQPIILLTRDSVVSIPFYTELYNKCRYYYSNQLSDISPITMNQIPISFINLKINTKMDEDDCISKIKSVINSNKYFSGRSWYYISMKDSLDTVSGIILNVYSIVTVVVLFFCFFNLVASMTINIFDQKKEIAIIRSLGLKKKELFYIYISESCILILSASLIGTIIGSTIAYTMGLLWQMFMNIQTGFPLNIKYLLLVIGFSLLGGLMSTIIPTIQMMKYSISDLIRNA